MSLIPNKKYILLRYETKTWIDRRETIFAAIQKIKCLVKSEHKKHMKTLSKSQFLSQVLIYLVCPHLNIRS